MFATPESRVLTHLSQRRWQASAPTRTLSGFRPRATVLPDHDCKQPRSAATGLCAAATLTSQCLRRNTPKGALTADAPHQPREADSTLRTTLQHPERRRNDYDSRTANPLASGRRQRLLLQIRHRDCSCPLLPASNSSCFTAPRTARFSGCLPCREAEQTALPSLARRKHLGGLHAALRSAHTSAGPLRGRRTRGRPTRSRLGPADRPVSRTDQQLLLASCVLSKRATLLPSGHS